MALDTPKYPLYLWKIFPWDLKSYSIHQRHFGLFLQEYIFGWYYYRTIRNNLEHKLYYHVFIGTTHTNIFLTSGTRSQPWILLKTAVLWRNQQTKYKEFDLDFCVETAPILWTIFYPPNIAPLNTQVDYLGFFNISNQIKMHQQHYVHLVESNTITCWILKFKIS